MNTLCVYKIHSDSTPHSAGRGDSPQLSALVRWQVVVSAQLISNGSETKVEDEGEQHAQHNGAGNAKPKGDLTGKSQTCC